MTVDEMIYKIFFKKRDDERRKRDEERAREARESREKFWKELSETPKYSIPLEEIERVFLLDDNENNMNTIL